MLGRKAEIGGRVATRRYKYQIGDWTGKITEVIQGVPRWRAPRIATINRDHMIDQRITFPAVQVEDLPKAARKPKAKSSEPRLAGMVGKSSPTPATHRRMRPKKPVQIGTHNANKDAGWKGNGKDAVPKPKNLDREIDGAAKKLAKAAATSKTAPPTKHDIRGINGWGRGGAARMGAYAAKAVEGAGWHRNIHSKEKK